MARETIDLAASAGLLLDPWQQFCLCDIQGVQPDGRWAAPETCDVISRQTGKGGIIEALQLSGLFLFGERMILHSAHLYPTAQEAFLRIRDRVDGCGDLSRYVKAIRETNGEQQIILMSGARLRFIARSKGGGRGFSVERLILDEAQQETRTQLSALLPTMSAQRNPQVNHFATAPDPDSMPPPDEAVLPAIRQRALAAIETGEPGALVYHDWSMRDGEDPASVDLWYECNPALGIRIGEDYVASELAALGPEKFSIERLGMWPRPDQEKFWRVISEADWRAGAVPELQHPSPVAFALTLSSDRQWATICAAGPIGDGLVGVFGVDRREGTGWVIPRLLELVERWAPVATVAFRNSPAESLATQAEEAGIEIVSISLREMAGATGAFIDGFAGRAAVDPATGLWGPDPRVLRHRDQDYLNAAVAAAVLKPASQDRVWDPLAAKADITPAIGCANALWGYTTRAPQPSTEGWVFFR